MKKPIVVPDRGAHVLDTRMVDGYNPPSASMNPDATVAPMPSPSPGVQMKTVAVPKALARKQYLSVFESLGFDVKSLRRLDFGVHGIFAEVMERDEDGKLVVDHDRDQVAVNRVYIPIRDD